MVLNDFESEEDLTRIAWRCKTTFALREEYRDHGRQGLLMTLYPDPYPGVRLLLTPAQRQWQGYRYLALAVFNPESEPMALHYRIDDRADPDYGDRVNGGFTLQPGENQLRLDLIATRTSQSNRPLELHHIQSLLFFLSAPVRPVAVGVDYIRLEKERAGD